MNLQCVLYRMLTNFQQAYTSVYAGNVIQHWIFYKEAETQEEAGKGIMTKENYKRLQK